MSKRIDKRKELFQASQMLDEMGIYNEQGHISVRTEPDADTFLINNHSSPGTTNLQDFVVCNVHDSEFPDSVPSETIFHAKIYQHRDDVNAICHSHSPYATVVSSVGLEMRPVHQGGVFQNGPVTVYDDYDAEGGTLITTEKEAEDVSDALGMDQAIALRGHGPIVVGESVTHAAIISIKLEYNSWLEFMQASVGSPWYLPESVIEGNLDLAFDERKMLKPLDYYLSQSG
jgi:ribulose-5-phosphate 4-epimerase/fuculose-1-phosphate aldolase